MLPQQLNDMPSQDPDQQQKTLLVVDDEQFVRQLCADALDRYRVILAADGQQALQLLNSQEIDIVLSDVVMPQLDGLELLSTINKQWPDLPVIMMTGHTEKNVILLALKNGASDFISKPINVLQLQTTVDKIIERTRLRQELTNLKQLNQLKNDFLGLVSHKLKTPTTAISLFIENLAGGITDPAAEDFTKTLAMVQTETQHLEKLIQDLLYYSDLLLQDRQLQLEPLDPEQIAAQVASNVELSALEKGLHFSVSLSFPPETPTLSLDRNRLSFALRALLDNAIKFTPAGGKVTLAGKIRNHRLELVVTDSGSGIPADELPCIFDKFYQVDKDNTGQVRGFGLGLFYARDFVRKMGGQLTIASPPGGGTHASIEFPLPA